jgi:outer membrane protein W
MRKLLVSLTIMLALSYSSFAQSTAYAEGQNTFSLGYGVGNLFKFVFDAAGESTSSTGPFALTYEHGFTDKISGGISIGYSELTGVINNSTDPSFTDIETDKLTSFDVALRGNYHFGESEKFDPYIGIGLVYYNFKASTTDVQTDNTTTPPTVTTNSESATFTVPGSIGFTGQLGAKYYFSPNIGAYAEVGYVAGSILQIGVTYKLAGGSN